MRKGDENIANTMRSQKRLNHLNVLFRHSMTIRGGYFVFGVLCHFHQYFSYIVAVSFIGGRNQST
jgi:hypothetical protein